MIRTVLSVVGLLQLCGCAGPAAVGSWPSWRGPEQNGFSRENAVVTSWSLDGKNLLWKSIYGGRSTPVVMDGRLIAIGPVGSGVASQERVYCLDADTGHVLWEHRFNVFHTDIVVNRVGWTSPVGDPETGNVYVHGTGGEMFCFDSSGNVVWKISMSEQFGRISGYGGRLHTPIVDENRVIVSYLSSSWGSLARPLHRYVALDKHTGDVLWWAAPGGKPLDTTYSTPVVTVIDGVRMLIACNADGNVYGMKARTGERLWTFRLSKRGLNPSAVVDGRFVYVCHSEENIDNTEMGRVVCIDASKRGDITETGEVWRYAEQTVGYSTPAVANGRLYLVDNSANLHCLDADTGKVHWVYNLGRVGKGSPVVTADGVIYVGEQNGIFQILRDEGNRCVSLDRHEFTREDKRVDEIFGSPAVCGGRVYFMTRYATYCLGTKRGATATTPIPPLQAETAASASQPGVLHITPAEVTVSPGESVTFTVTRFDANGISLGVERLPLTPVGLAGTMAYDGTFTAAEDNVFAAGFVLARADGLEAKARVRISPKLPIDEDFDSMAVDSVPPGWVGVASKTKIVEHNGNRVLQKLTTKTRPSPPFMRLRAYATPPIDGGYTVQADMFSTSRKRFRPDMGLINSRYRLILKGMEKVLRIDSWSPVPRVQLDVPLAYETDTWVRVKFQVELHGDEAFVRGKVWPRDSVEPSAWAIEFTDPHPNRTGSAGLYAYSAGTTHKSDGPMTLFDNFKVTRND